MSFAFLLVKSHYPCTYPAVINIWLGIPLQKVACQLDNHRTNCGLFIRTLLPIKSSIFSWGFSQLCLIRVCRLENPWLTCRVHVGSSFVMWTELATPAEARWIDNKNLCGKQCQSTEIGRTTICMYVNIHKPYFYIPIFPLRKVLRKRHYPKNLPVRYSSHQ